MRMLSESGWGTQPVPLLVNLSKIDKLYNLIILAYHGNMPSVSATHAKQNFAALLDAAQREPVRIRRHNRDIAVILSAEEYKRLVGEKWREFDRLSANAAAQGAANGLTEEKLQDILG